MDIQQLKAACLVGQTTAEEVMIFVVELGAHSDDFAISHLQYFPQHFA